MFPNSLTTNIFRDDNPYGNSMFPMFPMNQMMNSVFGRLPYPMGGVSFGSGGMFGNISSIVSSMNIQTNIIGGNYRGHSFNNSTFMSYSSYGSNGQPQVYKASTSTRTGPGGIKETKKAVSDSRTGVMKLAIGHHIRDRAHIVKRQQNVYSGEQEETQEYINLDDEELGDFNNEWRTKVQTMNSYRNRYSPYKHGARKSTKPIKKHLKLSSSTSHTSDVLAKKKKKEQGRKRSVKQRKPKKLISDELAIGDSKNKKENVQSSSKSLK